MYDVSNEHTLDLVYQKTKSIVNDRALSAPVTLCKCYHLQVRNMHRVYHTQLEDTTVAKQQQGVFFFNMSGADIFITHLNLGH